MAVPTDRMELAARFVARARTLLDITQDWAQNKRTLKEWSKQLKRDLQTLIHTTTDAEKERFAKILSAVSAFPSPAPEDDDTLIPFPVIRMALENALGGLSRSSRDLLTHGVVVAPLGTLAGISFDTVYIAGCNDGVYPRVASRASLDIRHNNPQNLEFTRTQRDRYAFLQHLMTPTRRLVLGWNNHDLRTGETLAMSSLLKELQTQLETAGRKLIPTTSSSAALTPLMHSEAELPSKTLLAAQTKPVEQEAPRPIFTIRPYELIRFLTHPLDGYLRTRLRQRNLEYEDLDLLDTEPLKGDGFNRFQQVEAALRLQLQRGNEDTIPLQDELDREALASGLPAGVLEGVERGQTQSILTKMWSHGNDRFPDWSASKLRFARLGEGPPRAGEVVWPPIELHLEDQTVIIAGDCGLWAPPGEEYGDRHIMTSKSKIPGVDSLNELWLTPWVYRVLGLASGYLDDIRSDETEYWLAGFWSSDKSKMFPAPSPTPQEARELVQHWAQLLVAEHHPVDLQFETLLGFLGNEANYASAAHFNHRLHQTMRDALRKQQTAYRQKSLPVHEWLPTPTPEAVAAYHTLIHWLYRPDTHWSAVHLPSSYDGKTFGGQTNMANPDKKHLYSDRLKELPEMTEPLRTRWADMIQEVPS